MYKKVKFTNFKNIKAQEIKLSLGLNLFCGKNGVGKTNILEAISILSGWGPLEKGSENLVTWGSSLRGILLAGQTEENEIVEAQIAQKTTFRFCEKRINATELRQKIPLLMFLPQDLEIVEGTAIARRRILDIALSLIVPSYAYRLSEYRRAIKQKTIILKSSTKVEGNVQLEAINKAAEPLVEWIWSMREKYIALLAEEITKNNICPYPLTLQYVKSGTTCGNQIKNSFIEAVKLQRERELRFRYPIVGPHRDEIFLFTEGKAAKAFLSRGQRRRTAISIMLAVTDTITRKIGRTPILLLDEIMSDLDREARKILLAEFIKRGGQICATTTEIEEELAKEINIRVLNVIDGAIE
ncbi:MAG: DNA replication and repair protein RecF [Synergistaceae bacterium]|nr:DNA replication and repair protein RecF [Synergistaceae bacterium]